MNPYQLLFVIGCIVVIIIGIVMVVDGALEAINGEGYDE